MFKKGDKVRVKDPNGNFGRSKALFPQYNVPIEGVIYTIREYIPNSFGYEAILLDEIKNKNNLLGDEINFAAELFEVIEVKQKRYF